MAKNTTNRGSQKSFKKKQSKKEIELLDEIALLTESLKRSQADFVNLKNRVEKDNEQFIKYANASLLEKIIPIVDQLYLACSSVTGENKNDKWVEGICQIAKLFEKELENFGVKKIETIGKKYHPEFHEAVMRGKGTEKDIILDEFETGYMFHDRVLRPAKVKVCTEVKKDSNSKK